MSKAAKSAKTDAPPRRDYDRRKRTRSDPRARPADLAPAADAGPRRAAAGRRRRRRLVGLEAGLAGRGADPARCRRARRHRRASRRSSWPTSRSRAATMSSATRSWRRSTCSAGDSLLAIDLQAARKRLEAIDWVASATVERRLPDTLYVTLKERRAVAIWQNGSEYTLIDRNGRTVRASRMPPGAEKLLLLGGPGAPEHVGELLLLLAYEPAIAKQLRAAVWVGHRRWNLVLEQRHRDLAAGGRCGRGAAAHRQARRSRTSCCRASSAWSTCGCRTSSISGSVRRRRRTAERTSLVDVAYKHGETSWPRQETG